MFLVILFCFYLVELVDSKLNKNKFSIKILYYLHNSVCRCLKPYVDNKNCFVCYFFVYTLCINNKYYQTIVRLIFLTEIFSLRLLSSNIPHHLPVLPCRLHGIVNSLVNVLEVEGFSFLKCPKM